MSYSCVFGVEEGDPLDILQNNADSLTISFGTLKPSQWVLLFGVKLEQGCTGITGYTVQQIKL